MDVPVEFRQWAERILIGSGLSVAEAAVVAAGGPLPVGAQVPEVCMTALRDGWATQSDPMHAAGVAS